VKERIEEGVGQLRALHPEERAALVDTIQGIDAGYVRCRTDAPGPPMMQSYSGQDSKGERGDVLLRDEAL
jgi:hypothetical protein